jgi:hypothetical protein
MVDFFGINALLKILRLRKPGVVFLVYRQNMENDMLKFVFVLPPAGAHDVVNRELSVQIGNGEPQVINVDTSTNESPELSGMENDVVKGSLVDIDDAGNRSEPRDFEMILLDTLAPPKPGELGLRVTEETEDVPPPVDPPEPDEPPVV